MRKCLLAAALLVLLTACGAEKAPVQEPPVEEQPTAVVEEQPAQETVESPVVEEAAPVEEEVPAEQETADPLLEQAVALIDSNVEDLYDAIGYPVDVMYADSCLGEGEDGELYYDGFTVYTYRDTTDVETIYDVMAN